MAAKCRRYFLQISHRRARDGEPSIADRDVRASRLRGELLE
jgi:hypothetical protein